MNNKVSDHLIFVPLGGAGEIGMNLNLYGYGLPGKENWIMIDLGVTFKSVASEGIDTIMPDIAFIEPKKANLTALILTHAHEDHIGAVPFLWPRLRCPIYASPFTAAIIKSKLEETECENKAEIIIQELDSKFTIGPFNLQFITLTHSIPEPNAVAITTGAGTIVHTGDWKFDPKPVYGPTFNLEALQKVGSDGVLAVVCDSTNVFEQGESGSESAILKDLTESIALCSGKVLVACFASNVARLETIAKAAKKNGRTVAISGRSLKRMEKAARDIGYLSNIEKFISDKEAGYIPDDRVLVICTGSQGEPRAALKKIASGLHPHIYLKEEDTVIFSSRIIPGNELAINDLFNLLIKNNVQVVTPGERCLHVSGHPSREELVKMYKLLSPKISIPVHGEYRHLKEHAQLALDCKIPQAIVVENGNVVKFSKNKGSIIDTVTTGRLALDGKRLISMQSEIYKSRKRALWNGTATLSIKVDLSNKKVFAPRFTSTGLFEHETETLNVCKIAKEIVEINLRKGFVNCGELEEKTRIAVRKYFKEVFGKKPITTVHIVSIDN